MPALRMQAQRPSSPKYAKVVLDYTRPIAQNRNELASRHLLSRGSAFE